MRKRTIEQALKSGYFRLNELAEYCKIPYSTVKYYAELGIIPYRQLEKRRIRRFPIPEAVDKLKTIIEMRNSGLSVPQVVAKILEDGSNGQ